jgi:uncharacterized membrane protein YfhO
MKQIMMYIIYMSIDLYVFKIIIIYAIFINFIIIKKYDEPDDDMYTMHI